MRKCLTLLPSIHPRFVRPVFVFLCSQVQLPKYMVETVSDRLAENIHEMWSKVKIDQGWQYAAVRLLVCARLLSIRQVRDDAKKLHPMLIPYEELSAVEKAYDLDMALGTLKVNALLACEFFR